MQGSRFTWKGPIIGTYDRLFEKLDRALCNREWRVKFPEASVKTLPRISCDHHPILINIKGNLVKKTNRPFGFEAAWLTHEKFSEFMKAAWREDLNAVAALSGLTPLLVEWNKEVFGNLKRRKKELLARINGIQKSLEEKQSLSNSGGTKAS